MSQITTEETWTLYTTPKQLREWADKIEQHMEKATLGQSVIAVYLHVCPGKSLNIGGDQDAYNRHRTGNKSRWV